MYKINAKIEQKLCFCLKLFIKLQSLYEKYSFFPYFWVHFISRYLEIKEQEEFVKIKLPEVTFIFILILEKIGSAGL